jgi:hypothetical protein
MPGAYRYSNGVGSNSRAKKSGGQMTAAAIQEIGL